MTVSAIVLAAGEGTRMRSTRPKPLHMMCGRAMVMHVIAALEQLQPARTALVVGHGAEQVTKKVQDLAPAWANVVFVEQAQQRGTGDAAAIGMTAFPGDDLDDDSTIVVVPGDAPLLLPDTLDELVATHVANGSAATLLTSVVEDPTGYGRVVTGKDGRVIRIVEQRDASPEERAIDEIATSIYAFRRDLLGPALRSITPNNVQGELYLTDVIGVLAGMGHRVGRVQAPGEETQGVNDRWQLARAERELRDRTNRHWLLNGVTMLDPSQTFIDVTVQLGRDVTLYPGTILEGNTVVGDGTEIGPHTRLDDCVVGRNCRIQHTVGLESEIGDGARVGPYCHLPAGSHVAKGTATGAFYTAPTD
jgi:bifunctional UDP-N-acetylglucosamine pyrophosphorylase/glucosamine-1-phosphate N-acetyltransferase